jgi:RimJ/RimL family protein N-acetyltransferase
MLKGRLVRLAAPLDADFAVMAAWHGDGEFLRQLDAEPAAPRTEAQLKKRWTEKAATGCDYYFTLRTLDGDRLVGYAGLSSILWNHGAAWLEMAVAPGEQGRGFGGDGLAVALRFAFGELNLRRVQLTVFGYNARAIALYEKMGFQREGAYREFLLRDGRAADMLLYGMLRREWAP